MDIVIDILTWPLLISGAVFSMIGGFGIIRLPEFFSRMHAGGITDTLGAGLIIGGLMLQGGLSLVTVKLFMIIFFLIITSPSAISFSTNHSGATDFAAGRPYTKPYKMIADAKITPA